MKKILGLFAVVLLVMACSSDKTNNQEDVIQEDVIQEDVIQDDQFPLSDYAKIVEDADATGQYGKAIETLKDLFNKENDETLKTKIIYNIGECYEKSNDYDKAFEYYNKVIERDPSFQPALYIVGKYYYDKRDYDNALKTYKQFIAVNPEHAGVYYMIGLVQKDLGNKEESLKYMQKAADLAADLDDIQAKE